MAAIKNSPLSAPDVQGFALWRPPYPPNWGETRPSFASLPPIWGAGGAGQAGLRHAISLHAALCEKTYPPKPYQGRAGVG